MDSFRDYVEGDEEHADVHKTLDRIPGAHRRLVQGYTISFQGGNTLQGDGEHVGVIQTHPEPHITIAAPWRYSRELTVLHEVGHLVWAQLPQDKKREWEDLVRSTPMKDGTRQPAEELFSMAYGAAYSKHPPVTYYKREWVRFIRSV